jgi:hypothetical protein
MRAATVRIVLMCAGVLGAILASGVLADAQQLAPTNLTASLQGHNVIITWRAGGDLAPDAFRLEAGSASGLSDLAIVNIPWSRAQGVEAQFAAAGVAPGVYYLRVRGLYGGVASESSQEAILRVDTAACPLPNAPRNVSASVTSDLVTLDWEPSATGGEAAGYVIEAGSVPGAPNVAIITLDATRVSVSAPPGRYFVRLRAMGQCGASEPSPEVVIVVP